MPPLPRLQLSFLTLVALVLSSVAAFAQGPTVGGYELVSQRRITLTVTEFTYRATLSNVAGAIQSATATVASNSPNTVVVDNALSFGAIGAGGSGASGDTFSIRQNRTAAFNPADLVWTVSVVPAGGGGAPVALRVQAIPSVRAGNLFSVVVEALDAGNNVAGSFAGTVNLSAAAIGGSNFAAGPQAAAAVGGVATFTNVVLNNAADNYQVTATAAGLTSGLSNLFSVTASHLLVPSVMANHKAGTLFSLTVEARDADNAVAENFTGNINLDAAAVGGSNFTGGTKTVAALAGAATFNGLALNNAANSYTITGSAAGVTSGVGNSFNVTFTTLRVVAVPNVPAGTLFNVQVEALDANAALAENFDAGNSVSLVNLQAAVIASGQTAFNAPVVPSFGGGTATFTGLAINNAADGYTFSAFATSSGSPVLDAIDAGFNVTASHLLVPGVMANHKAGTVFSLTVEARDANNLLAENFTGNINLDAAAVGGSNFTGGTKTVAALAGAATFNGLALNNAANSYTITGSAAGVTSGVGNSFNVTFTTLRVVAVPNVPAGALFNVQVEALDANAALAENFDAGNSVSLVNLQAAVIASGQTAFNAPVVPSFGGGTATFTGLAINNAADGYTFSAFATSSGSPVLDAIDAGFNVTASHLLVPGVMANHKAGTVFSLTVEARDANNLLAENFTGNINLDASTTGGSNFTGGTKTVAALAGAATFNNLSLNNAANNYAITGSAAGVTSGVGNTFNVTFATLRVVAVANVRAGDLFNVQVEALDANAALAENFDAGNSVSLVNLQAAVIASGQTAFNAPVVPTFGGGTATFTGLAINNAADGYTFSAFALSSTSPVLDAIDAGFNVTARQVFVPGVMANHEAGTVFSLTVEARDANNVLAENFTGNINLDASAVGGSNFTGGTKTVAAVAGSAIFNNLSIGTAADNYVITGSAAGLISGIGNTFNVTGGAGGSEADSLELSLSQSAIGAGGSITIGALVLDGLGEPIVPNPNINYQIFSDEGASGPLPTVLNGVIATSAATRGGYILQGQVDGTTVTDDVVFAVTANAAQSPNAGKFATLAAAEGTIATKLTELAAAMEANNLAALPAIKTALQNAANSVPTTGRNAIQRARVVAPESGFLPSLAQLNAAGFTETPADIVFGNLLGQINTKLNQIRAFYDALPTAPGAGATDSVAALNQLNTELEGLQVQLEALNVTPHGVVKHATAINNLIRNTMPLHMKSVVAKVTGILTANALAGMQSTPGEFFDGTRPAEASLALASPDGFYAKEQPAFFGFVGLFAGCSLQMNLVNRIYGPVLAQVSRMMVILAANALLQEYVNPASLVALITGGSQSFHAYGIPGSVIEGFGFNMQNVASNEVFLIGGGAVAAVEGLIDAFNPGNIDSFDDIDDYFQGIIDAFQGAGEAYNTAEQPPDGLAFGCVFDDGGCNELVYNSGFENVASCSGFFCFDFTVIVLYHNKDTGHWASTVVNFDP